MILAIIQARMNSTRLPRKVLMDIVGEPMLARVVERVKRAKSISNIVVATTVNAADDCIAALCKERHWNWHRGGERDVLDRFFGVTVPLQPSIIVRITADCPLVDPGLIDEVAGVFVTERPDYASNIYPERTYPRGLDVEVFWPHVLRRIWREADNPYDREHVTTYVRCNLALFDIASVTNDVDYSHYRWSVDTIEDLTLVRKIYEHFGNGRFTWKEAIEWIEA